MWMSNCLRNTLIHNAVMYLISHPLMVLPPSSRDYPGEAGGGAQVEGEWSGAATEAVHGGEHGLRRAEVRGRKERGGEREREDQKAGSGTMKGPKWSSRKS